MLSLTRSQAEGSCVRRTDVQTYVTTNGGRVMHADTEGHHADAGTRTLNITTITTPNVNASTDNIKATTIRMLQLRAQQLRSVLDCLCRWRAAVAEWDHSEQQS